MKLNNTIKLLNKFHNERKNGLNLNSQKPLLIDYFFRIGNYVINFRPVYSYSLVRVKANRRRY